MAEASGVPKDDERGKQGETCHAVVLALGGSIADFTLAANAKGVFQSVMRFPLIQTNIGTSLHIGIEQPLDDEQSTLDAPNFTQCQGKFVLSRI